jgi:oxazoline/thiazoline synthase
VSSTRAIENMLTNPKFNQRFRIEAVEAEGIFLVSERGAIVLSDRLLQSLVPLLDGNRTADEIVEHLQDKIPAPYIYYALMELEQKGYLVENKATLPENLAIFCQYLNVDLKEAYHRLQTTKVALKAIGNLSAAELASMLESLHIQVAEEADLEVVLTDSYLRTELAAVNQENLARSRPWMLVKPTGTLLWLGPLFSPQKTGCWECLAHRLRGNRPVEPGTVL